MTIFSTLPGKVLSLKTFRKSKVPQWVDSSMDENLLSQIVFYCFAALTIGSAIKVVFARSLMQSAFAAWCMQIGSSIAQHTVCRSQYLQEQQHVRKAEFSIRYHW